MSPARRTVVSSGASLRILPTGAITVLALGAIVGLAACGANPERTVDTSAARQPAAAAALVATAPATTVDPRAPRQIVLIVGKDDAATTGGRTESVPIGVDVSISIKNAKAEEYHLTGYDLTVASPEDGAVAVLSFRADQAGTFDLTSETTDKVLLVLDVR